MSDASRLGLLFRILALCALTSATVFAQMATAALTGVISDPKGDVVPDVEVTATRIETGTVLTTKTNGAGIYFFTGLLPGRYHLMIHKPGFKEIAIKEFELHVQDKLEQNFSLEIGSVSETVTVTANDLNVNTSDAAVSTVIDRDFVSQLPLNGRSFNTLLQLTPGVVIAPSNNLGGNPGQFSIAGQRTDSNNFTVDGVSANFGVSLALNGTMGAAGTGSAQAFSVLGGTSSLVSVEALQEFRIETSSFAPEFGRQPGGQVILSTRSGGNSFHGGIYDYFRNTVMDANDWFANDAGNSRAPEHHNDFGGFLGGPIWKDRTFFFASYEGARLDLPATQVIEVPYTGAGCTPPAAIAPFLAAFPQPNGPISTSDCTGQFTGTYSNHATLEAGSLRVDHTFNAHVSVFGRFNDAPSQSVTRALSLSTFDTSAVDTKTLTIGVNMLFSPSISNTIRGNYSTQSANTIEALDAFGGAIPIDPSLLLGSLSSANAHGEFYTFDTNNLEIGPLARSHATQLNFVDDLNISVGAHQLKFGGDYRAIFTTTAPALNYLSYGADSVQSFLASEQATLFASTTATAHFLSQSFSVFAQDTWKVSARLTFTYGLRWELSPAPSPRGNTVLASWQDVNTPSLISLAPQGTPLWKTTYNNFAPRIGIAYRLTDNGDFVVRAGAGIFYDLGVGASANTASAFPNDAALLTPTVSLPVTDVTSLLPVLSLQPPYSGTIYAFSPTLRLPRSYQWNLALEKSFGKSQVVSATYVGQSGRNLLRNEGLVSPTADFSPDTAFYLTLNDSTSSYNALQLQYRRPLSSRLQALLNYSWSQSLDDTSDDTVSTISNTIFSNKDDWGSSAFDVRQSVSGALHFDVPSTAKDKLLSALTRNWSLDSVVVARTGFPFNAVLLTLGTVGGVYPRPDLVPGQEFWIPTSGAPGGKVLNPAAFTAPPTLQQGNEGRNDIKGFGLTQVDLSVGRRFPLTDRLSLQFRADAFNLFNHPNFANPNAYIGFGPAYLASQHMLNQALGGLNPLFQEGGPRSIQLSLRLTF
jgi:hypothetical protein